MGTSDIGTYPMVSPRPGAYAPPTTGFTTAGSGVSPPTTVSGLGFAAAPRRAGKSNALLFPPVMPFHNAQDSPSGIVHVSAPTHGCTFQPNSKVMFPREASWPLMSVIWYLGFWLLNFRIPGRGVEEDFKDLDALEGGVLAKKERGLKGLDWDSEGIMVSQIMAWDGGGLSDSSSLFV